MTDSTADLAPADSAVADLGKAGGLRRESSGAALSSNDGPSHNWGQGLMQGRVLICEDEATQRRILEAIVTKSGFEAECVPDGKAAMARLVDQQAPPIDVMLLDLVMPGMDGIEVLNQLRAKGSDLPVILLTARSSINTVVDAMKAGASDFIVKPASAERIRSAISAGLKSAEMVGEIAGLRGKLNEGLDERGFDGLIGNSRAMQNAKRLARKAAASNIPVLIDGESGVGKEVFARAIHQSGPRRGKPFVAVNCGAIPENLVESTLFGHEKGSFTGATEARDGVFQQADQGTLFLDEVGELPLEMQVKLLRALQEREVQRVGARTPQKVDIRIISATNRDLVGAIADGGFREDLFYRLNVYPVRLPPLRDRLEDIPQLAAHFVRLIAKSEGLSRKALDPSTLDHLQGYQWPGNIRQLQNALFRAVVLAEGQTLFPSDFPHLHRETDRQHGGGGPAASSARLENRLSPVNGHVSSPPMQPPSLSQPAAPSAQPVIGRPLVGDLSLTNADGHVRSMKSIEADIIRAAILRYDGRMAEVARRLGIGRSTLYRKVTAYGLEELARIRD